GAIVEQYEYDPFGKQSVYDGTGNALGGSAYGVVYGFQGRRHDAETGLMYFRNRYYDPHLGRFLTLDPIGVWGDAGNWGNGMGFVKSNPILLDDPFGQMGQQGGGPNKINSQNQRKDSSFKQFQESKGDPGILKKFLNGLEQVGKRAIGVEKKY
ncbi:MAG TPA: RHS repeat-associated core domain-containing protein, partial [Planctomycetes bacterium]|nr:RHS repeat-associated core domain-containing protein [Planctomycetota bacterium]